MLSAGDHALLTSAMAVALVLAKALEKFVDWMTKRLSGKDNKPEVMLAAEPTRLLRETHEASSDLSKIIGRTDSDGLPLVYTPRSVVTNQLEMAQALKDVVRDHERTVESLEQLGVRVSEILNSIKK